MAAKHSVAAENSLQKINSKITCEICLNIYNQPKLLKCFHVFCEQCLQHLVCEGSSVTCPQCQSTTSLPHGKVSELQGAIYITNLLDIHDTLKKVSSNKQAMCNICKKREAVHFCCTCGLLCATCEEQHHYWNNLKLHKIIDLDIFTEDVTSVISSLKKTIFCSKHSDQEADLYCETCNELVCTDCIIKVHRDHQYYLVSQSFARQEKVIVDSLKQVTEQIAMLESALESIVTRCATVIKQKTALVAEIHSTVAHLQQVLQAREAELVSGVEQMAQLKLKNLTAQRDEFEVRLGQLSSCHDFVQGNLHNCSQKEILRMKAPLVKQINHLTANFNPETLTLAEQADMRFAHSLQEVAWTCQQFGKVYCHPVCPENCRALGKGIENVATMGQTVSVLVEVLNGEGEACIKPIESLKCELVSSHGSSRVSGTVNRRNQNMYNISYQPQVTGEHQLHILIEEQPIFNSPFTVTVLPNLTAPANIIGDLEEPWGIAVREEGQIVVAEHGRHCISILNASGENKVSVCGSNKAEISGLEGVAIDGSGNILVSDCWNHCIQKMSSTGQCMQVTGAHESGPVQLLWPSGIAVHPKTKKVYVADYGNHQIQVLNSDLTYSSSFGCKGSNSGEFNHPYDISTDSDGNVYVTDWFNHRIQVFTADGVYLRQFGKEGEGDGELIHPVSIAIDNHNIVYVGGRNDRVSLFLTNGEFIKSFGGQEGPVQFKGLRGLAVDKNGTLYICDTFNRRVQIFT